MAIFSRMRIVWDDAWRTAGMPRDNPDMLETAADVEIQPKSFEHFTQLWKDSCGSSFMFSRAERGAPGCWQ